MPDITRHGITISAAAQEAAASAVVTRAMLCAYELWHPTFIAPLRFVNDVAPLTATLEAGAPRNASATVEFIACPLERTQPEENDQSASPSVSLTRPDVSGILKEALDAARGSTEPWVLIERVYASDDTSTPAFLPPRIYEVTAFDLSSGIATMNASYGDWINVSIPRATFKRSQYPGLQR